jgi:hypothetical protein
MEAMHGRRSRTLQVRAVLILIDLGGHSSKDCCAQQESGCSTARLYRKQQHCQLIKFSSTQSAAHWQCHTSLQHAHGAEERQSCRTPPSISNSCSPKCTVHMHGVEGCQSVGARTLDLEDGFRAVPVRDVQRVGGVVHDDAAVLPRMRHQFLLQSENDITG